MVLAGTELSVGVSGVELAARIDAVEVACTGARGRSGGHIGIVVGNGV